MAIEFLLFFGGGADDAPDLLDAFVEGGVVEVAEVGDEVGGESLNNIKDATNPARHPHLPEVHLPHFNYKQRPEAGGGAYVGRLVRAALARASFVVGD